MKTAFLLLLLVPANGFTPLKQAPTVKPSFFPKTAPSFIDVVQQTGLALCFSAIMFVSSPVFAVTSFAGQDISGQDFSKLDLSGLDFSGVIAKGTKFTGSNLQGASFRKANLVKADFSGAYIQTAHFEDAILDGSIFRDVLGQESVFSETMLDVADFENADLTSSLWPSKYRIMLCDGDEMKGVNKVTGVDTRESLMCTDYTRR